MVNDKSTRIASIAKATSKITKKIAQKMKDVFVTTFVMTDKEAADIAVEIAKLKAIFKELKINTPTCVTKILMMTKAIVTALRKNGVELLTEKRQLITPRRMVSRIIAIERTVSAASAVSAINVADAMVIEKVKEIVLKMNGIPNITINIEELVELVHESSFDAIMSAAKVSKDAFKKAVLSAVDCDRHLINSIQIIINFASVKMNTDSFVDLIAVIKSLERLIKRNEDELFSMSTLVEMAAASNYTTSDDEEPSKRNAFWKEKKIEIWNHAKDFIHSIYSFDNIYKCRDKKHSILSSMRVYLSQNCINKAIIALIIANEQQQKLVPETLPVIECETCEDKCSICLEKNMVLSECETFKCNHTFHLKCLIGYCRNKFENKDFQNKKISCPLCRKDVFVTLSTETTTTTETTTISFTNRTTIVEAYY